MRNDLGRESACDQVIVARKRPGFAYWAISRPLCGVCDGCDDPLRKALGILGAYAEPGAWRRPEDWARDARRLGLVKQLFSPSGQDTAEGRKRGIGVTMSAHQGETFMAETDSHLLRMRLEKRRGRFRDEGWKSAIQVRYRYVHLTEEGLPLDENMDEE